MSEQTFHCPAVLLPNGWRSDCLVRVDDQAMISDICPGEPDNASVHLPGPVIAGMVNVHSHVHQRLIAGMTGHRASGKDSFWTWREQMYRAVSQLSGEELQILAAWTFMELLEGGYTSIGEFHYPHRVGGSKPAETAAGIIAAANLSGIALTLLPVWYRYSGFGRQAVGERQAPFVLDLPAISELIAALRDQTDGSLHRTGMAPHSLRAVDAAELPGLLDAIPDGPVHMHISEQLVEVDECRRHSGVTPIELLSRHVELNDRWCLIHATHATVPEIRLLAESGAVVGICPTTEADLGDGVFPVRSFTDLGGRVAIGSDSNVVVNAAVELRQMEWNERLARHERNVLCDDGGHTGRWLWQSAAESGAQAICQPAGALEIGRRADFVVLDKDHAFLRGLGPDQQLDSFVLAGSSGMISQVYVGGRKLVDDGMHPGRDELAPEIARLRNRLAETT